MKQSPKKLVPELLALMVTSLPILTGWITEHFGVIATAFYFIVWLMICLFVAIPVLQFLFPKQYDKHLDRKKDKEKK